MIQATVPKGTRDFLPEEVAKRDYIFNLIRSVFRKYGYQPLETPAMENLSTLMGKYGDEGDKLLFKILNSGDYLKDIFPGKIAGITSRELTSKISEKGLRYDLTVPFARYVVQHRNEINFPFKRYQIQPVWRADRPQKGRYREFYQCDVDVIGSNSLLNELELVQIIDEIFSKLGINITIRINHRKILLGLCEKYGITDQCNDFVVALDKIEKAGLQSVKQELAEKNISVNIEEILKISELAVQQNNATAYLKELFRECQSENGLRGINDLEILFDYLETVMPGNRNIRFDITLARGLNYYTGCIFEVVSNEIGIGSICGGGRYDDLTGIFGLKDVSGTGVSFGAERIFDVLNKTGKFPVNLSATSRVLVVNFGSSEEKYCLPLLAKIRAAGISAEIYPESAKLKKQMDYANQKHIPFVLLIGSREMETGHYQLKNMETGEQSLFSLDKLIQFLQN